MSDLDGTTHWAGCYIDHPECALAMITRLLAERDQAIEDRNLCLDNADKDQAECDELHAKLDKAKAVVDAYKRWKAAGIAGDACQEIRERHQIEYALAEWEKGDE